MLRGVKRSIVEFPNGKQEVVFVQTPEHAQKFPPTPEKDEVVDTVKDLGALGPLIGFAEKMQVLPLNPRSFIYRDGIVCDYDVTIVTPDGTKLYADLFRPDITEKVPVIMCWSSYGKQQLKVMPTPDGEWVVCGAADGVLSKETKFEAADPGYWCKNGYVICNIDSRGTFNAEGDIHTWSSPDGDDAYNVIEWLAQQSWCNGKVALFGNSYLGISQWLIASKRPPHLTCIAPWDGTSDVYRDLCCIGGIPDTAVLKTISYKSLGRNYVEDAGKMLEENPYFDCPYWQDKKFAAENITIPVYCAAGWTGIHLRGTVRAFEQLGSDRKWIRFHRTWEWADDYVTEHLEDLKRFYDRYLKDINNGWEMTPRVRIDVMDAFDCDYQKYRPEFDFPLARTEYRKLYLNAANGTMGAMPPNTASKVVYDTQTGETYFDIRFAEDTEITGHVKLKLWVEAEEYNNMDLFVVMKKVSTKGDELPLYYFESERYGNTRPEKIKMWNPMPSLTAPYPGTLGRIRVSRRKLDEQLSTDYWPVQAHTCDEYLEPGQIVPVEIELLPTSRIWHKGQTLRLTISGTYKREQWLFPEKPQFYNKGKHIVYAGGQYDSYLQIPVIPPKYVDGDYVYR